MHVCLHVCLHVCHVQASDVNVYDVLRCAYTSVSFIRFAHSSQVFLQLHLVSIDGSGICII